jgi:hypothetical protein
LDLAGLHQATPLKDLTSVNFAFALNLGLEQEIDDQRIITQDLLLQQDKVANLPHDDPEFLK